MNKKHNPHIGSSLDDLLAEEGLLEECEDMALKELWAILPAEDAG